ncbi:hypothetical protein MA16_Dca000556 [Dendrobium catenatum]|uniref:Uncharacterized protein n=1 Tax=Dendrobium catenatum TaxID=906689 RepID=A0A2I0WU67_9ASPA|nr:hypothetical protein MA16_Dca000556 [Dendrobium catenatum]
MLITENRPSPGTEGAAAGDKEAARNQGATATGNIPGSENQQPAGIPRGKRHKKTKAHGGSQGATHGKTKQLLGIPKALLETQETT